MQPAERAGPTFLVIMARGKFQGVIRAVGPTGCFKARKRLGQREPRIEYRGGEERINSYIMMVDGLCSIYICIYKIYMNMYMNININVNMNQFMI